ncbi:MAG: hypothetical protein E6G10_02910 [Actinobacteria bacterium]|nr:MAG: hypothetical protein E6G10_02910 [Actinomycetota bacterium]
MSGLGGRRALLSLRPREVSRGQRLLRLRPRGLRRRPCLVGRRRARLEVGLGQQRGLRPLALAGGARGELLRALARRLQRLLQLGDPQGERVALGLQPLAQHVGLGEPRRDARLAVLGLRRAVLAALGVRASRRQLLGERVRPARRLGGRNLQFGHALCRGDSARSHRVGLRLPLAHHSELLLDGRTLLPGAGELGLELGVALQRLAQAALERLMLLARPEPGRLAVAPRLFLARLELGDPRKGRSELLAHAVGLPRAPAQLGDPRAQPIELREQPVGLAGAPAQGAHLVLEPAHALLGPQRTQRPKRRRAQRHRPTR